MATVTKAGEYLFNKEIQTRQNNYYCTSFKTINALRMLLILSIYSKIFPKRTVIREANGGKLKLTQSIFKLFLQT